MRALGIDLGTSTTLAAAHGQVLVPRGAASPIVPSVVAYPPSGPSLVGEAARRRRAMDPRNTLSSTKRVIGARYGSSRMKLFAEHHVAYDLCATEDGALGIRTRHGVVTPTDVAATLAGSLLASIDPSWEGAPVVVTVPAAFDDAERRATRDAMMRATAGSVRCVDEPVATAVAYLGRSNLRHAAVYDLGGGTFDVTIVDCSIHPFRVLGYGGDPYLGGEDVDAALATLAADRVLRADGWDLANDEETFDRLLWACEEAKTRLAHDDVTTIEIAAIDPAAPPSVRPIVFDRKLLDTITGDIVRASFVHCDAALAQAGLHARDIDAVFLAGGSTLLPMVAPMVTEYFGKRPRRDLDPMHVVAIGASLVASRPDLAIAAASGVYSV